jgi:DUF1365 family protein
MSHAICTGQVYHSRRDQASHAFNYALYMLLIDLKDPTLSECRNPYISSNWYSPIRFQEKDYLPGQKGSLQSRVQAKLQELGAEQSINKVLLLTQARCLGLYFSPVNFYFCYPDNNDHCRYLLAEVSNTPWNERHYYLVDLQGNLVNKKDFHVSPFMQMQLDYHWQIQAPDSGDRDIRVHIENHDKDKGKIFDATLLLKQSALTKQQARRTFWRHPMMTLKIVSSIYYQALRLALKRVQFVPYLSRKRDAQH